MSLIAGTFYPLGGPITGHDGNRPVALQVYRNDNGHLTYRLDGRHITFNPDAALTLAAIHNRALAIDDGQPSDLGLPQRRPGASLHADPGTGGDWFGNSGTHRQVTT